MHTYFHVRLRIDGTERETERETEEINRRVKAKSKIRRVKTVDRKPPRKPLLSFRCKYVEAAAKQCFAVQKYAQLGPYPPKRL